MNLASFDVCKNEKLHSNPFTITPVPLMPSSLCLVVSFLKESGKCELKRNFNNVTVTLTEVKLSGETRTECTLLLLWGREVMTLFMSSVTMISKGNSGFVWPSVSNHTPLKCLHTGPV